MRALTIKFMNLIGKFKSEWFSALDHAITTGGHREECTRRPVICLSVLKMNLSCTIVTLPSSLDHIVALHKTLLILAAIL